MYRRIEISRPQTNMFSIAANAHRWRAIGRRSLRVRRRRRCVRLFHWIGRCHRVRRCIVQGWRSQVHVFGKHRPRVLDHEWCHRSQWNGLHRLWRRCAHHVRHHDWVRLDLRWQRRRADDLRLWHGGDVAGRWRCVRRSWRCVDWRWRIGRSSGNCAVGRRSGSLAAVARTCQGWLSNGWWCAVVGLRTCNRADAHQAQGWQDQFLQEHHV